MKRWLCALPLVLCAACGPITVPSPIAPVSPSASPSADPTTTSPAPMVTFPDVTNAGMGRMDEISAVVDGDTVKLASTGASVRILGIDTPETKDPRKPVQCGGPEASEFAKRTLPVGTPVRLEFEPGATEQQKVDKYNRLLAYVEYRENGTGDWLDYSVEAARAGHARHYVYGRKPVSRHVEIEAAEAEARTARRGLWGSCPA